MLLRDVGRRVNFVTVSQPDSKIKYAFFKIKNLIVSFYKNSGFMQLFFSY